jgi:hypothetical protein
MYDNENPIRETVQDMIESSNVLGLSNSKFQIDPSTSVAHATPLNIEGLPQKYIQPPESDQNGLHSL